MLLEDAAQHGAVVGGRRSRISRANPYWMAVRRGLPSDCAAGGTHLYFLAPAGLELRNTAGTLGWRR